MSSKGHPLISVIMACYNAAPYVKQAISSALSQNGVRTEIIVVDDGSSDTSPDIVQKLADSNPGRVRLEHLEHSGPYPARNAGLCKARGDYVAFLDADDWWREDCLQNLYSGLQAAGADLAYCGWQNVGEHSLSPEPYTPPAYEADDPVAAFLRTCPWPIHAALVRRSVLESVGGFSERYFSSMDYDLWLRILAHTPAIVRVPEVMAYYRWHGSGQISAKRWKQIMNAVQVRRDFVRDNPQMVRHLSKEALVELIDGQLLTAAYRSYWNRDLGNAQKLFRAAFTSRAWHTKDLRYLLPALLPARVFRGIVKMASAADENV